MGDHYSGSIGLKTEMYSIVRKTNIGLLSVYCHKEFTMDFPSPSRCRSSPGARDWAMHSICPRSSFCTPRSRCSIACAWH